MAKQYNADIPFFIENILDIRYTVIYKYGSYSSSTEGDGLEIRQAASCRARVQIAHSRYE